MDTTIDELIRLLDLEQVELNLFRAQHPASRRKRLYGGQIMAQALVAAVRTVDEDRRPHSLHGYFLRPGDPSIPAVIDVERIRDGRSFATRRVVVIQHGQAIFNMDVSFQTPESGLTHQMAMPPGEPPDEAVLPAGMKTGAFIEFRVNHKQLLEEKPLPPAKQIWFKATAPVPADPALQSAMLVFQSDSALLGTARLPHYGSFSRARMQVASLDHVMYFHADVDLNEWLLYALDSPSTSGARGFTRGSIFAADGRLIASTMQEGLMRGG